MINPPFKEKEQPTSILDLPLQILERILEYVTKDGKVLSLVCKAFYVVMCKIYEDKLWFNLKSHDIVSCDQEVSLKID